MTTTTGSDGSSTLRTAASFLSGSWFDGASDLIVEDKFTGEVIGHLAEPPSDAVGQAIEALDAAVGRDWPAPLRRRVLLRAGELVASHEQEFIELMAAEAGFTRKDAAGEVRRARQTLSLCAEEATRICGEMLPLEGTEGVRQRLGFSVRVPVGVVAAITPFNSPLNTVCHKVGPALAAGNAVVLKPAAQTPFTAELLVRLLLESGVPDDRVALVQGGADAGRTIVDHPKVSFITFTGSTQVGIAIQREAGLRRTQLELGAMSSTIICDDARLGGAVAKCVPASFRKAGQVCTSIQQLFVQGTVFDQVLEAFAGQTMELVVGDPRDPRTDVGPLISEQDARRIEEWVGEAVAGGASIVQGGRRDGRCHAPTVMVDVPAEARLATQEVFGPVVCVRPFGDLDEALAMADDTPYGLTAGVFTQDIDRAMAAVGGLRMGSIHINQTSSSRLDVMPYGGVKQSGFGHEGPKYSIREMTDLRVVTITHADPAPG